MTRRPPPSTQDDDFTSFVRDTYGPLYRLAMSRVKDDALAADLIQETFFKVYRAYVRVEADDERNPLVLRHAIVVLINSLRDRIRSEERENRRLEAMEGAQVGGKLAVDPATMVTQEDSRTRFLLSLGDHPRQQQVFFLKEAGYSSGEIADILGMAEGTVRNVFTIVRNKLREWTSGH